MDVHLNIRLKLEIITMVTLNWVPENSMIANRSSAFESVRGTPLIGNGCFTTANLEEESKVVDYKVNYKL